MKVKATPTNMIAFHIVSCIVSMLFIWFSQPKIFLAIITFSYTAQLFYHIGRDSRSDEIKVLKNINQIGKE